MFRWLTACALVCGGVYTLMYFTFGLRQADRGTGEDVPESGRSVRVEAGPPPLRVAEAVLSADSRSLYIQEGRLVPVDKEEIPAEAEGRLLFIGKPYTPREGEVLPEDRFYRVDVPFLAVETTADRTPANLCFSLADHEGKLFTRWKQDLPLQVRKNVLVKEPRVFKKLEVGDRVEKGEVVAMVDPILAVNKVAIQITRYDAADADRIASQRTKDEYHRKYQSYLNSGPAISKDDLEGARLGWLRYEQEEIAKREKTKEEERSLHAELTMLRKHELRATISGIVQVLYKSRGDAVHHLDQVLQIQNTDRLRVEGLIGVEYARHLRKGMRAVVEASRHEPPRTALLAHTQQTLCVAVSPGDPGYLLSGGDDRMLRCWQVKGDTAETAWAAGPFPESVRACACTTGSGGQRLALVGVGDGSAWLYDLTGVRKEPNSAQELGERHKGAIHAVAFSPDGSICATAGEDRCICLWNVATRELIPAGGRITAAHRAPITSLQFTSNGQLISAAKDYSLIVWGVEREKAPVKLREFDRRSGDVAQLGSDGARVLIDQGKELRVQNLQTKEVEGVVTNPAGAANFTTLALFSPDGKTLLTNGAAEGRLQLWRTPPPGGRAAELRQFTWAAPITCGAFAPDGSFAVTGTAEGKVLVWPMPGKDEIEKHLPARLTLVEQMLNAGNQQVRIWAELEENPPWLVPNSTATLVIPLNQQ
jgi:WD40 repeat protein